MNETARTRIESILLAAFMLAGVLGVLKGLKPHLEPQTEFYWLFNYGHGFIKRGFIGTLVRPLVVLVSFERLKPVIVVAHVAVCLWIIYMLQALFGAAIARQGRKDTRLALTFAFLCLMCSQLMPVLAHDTGHVDVYVIALLLGGFWLILHDHYEAAVLVTVVGPLVHEAFVFLWAPVAIMLLWSGATGSSNRAKKLTLATLPLLCMGAVTWFHDTGALAAAMDAWSVDDNIKSGHLLYTFGSSPLSRFEHMRQFEYHEHWANLFISLAYFLVPSALLLWTALFSFWRQWSFPWPTLIVGTLAMLSPLSIILFGWDLSRFLSWSILAAAIALIGLSSPALIAIRAGHE